MEERDDWTFGGEPFTQTKLKIEFKTPIMTLSTYNFIRIKATVYFSRKSKTVTLGNKR